MKRIILKVLVLLSIETSLYLLFSHLTETVSTDFYIFIALILCVLSLGIKLYQLLPNGSKSMSMMLHSKSRQLERLSTNKLHEKEKVSTHTDSFWGDQADTSKVDLSPLYSNVFVLLINLIIYFVWINQNFN